MPRLVLAAGADPNRANDYGQTALHRASQVSDVAVAQALLDAGADPNRKDGSGATPLDEARANGHDELGALLLESGAVETEGTAETGAAIDLTHPVLEAIAAYLAALQARDVVRIRMLHPRSTDWGRVDWEPFLEHRPASIAACAGYADEGRATVRVTGPTASGAASLPLGFQLERQSGAMMGTTDRYGGRRISREWVDWPRRTE